MLSKLSLNLPTYLTLLRLLVSPLIMPLLIMWLTPAHNLFLNILLTLIFGLFSLTDFFDGYLARYYHQETTLGSLLDPLADKILVYSTLIALVCTGKLFYYWTVLIIGREFFVMGLRELALYHGFHVSVSRLGKLKTAIQLIFLAFVILNPFQSLSNQAPLWNGIQLILLCLTMTITLLSGFSYYRNFAKQWHLKKKTGSNTENTDNESNDSDAEKSMQEEQISIT